MPVHVYILYSSKIDKFYVSSTNDLVRRLQQHNTGQSTYTSTGIPWILLWANAKPTRHDAEILEQKLKNLTRVRKIRFMLKYSEGIRELEVLTSIIEVLQ